MPKDFTFVHVTDTHVTAATAEGSFAAKDARLFAEIDALRPAFVAATGDLTEGGTEAEFAVFQKIARDRLRCPLWAAPGNHDIRWNPHGVQGFVEATGQMRNRALDHENIRLLLLDSTLPLSHWGHFDAQTLTWLQDQLRRTGRDKPLVIGFHHPVGLEAISIDNEAAFRAAIAPYNVRLLLLGHGHSDRFWDVDGVPAVMARGLYQGSYHQVKVGGRFLEVWRRTEEKPTPTLLARVPLGRARPPRWKARLELARGESVALVERGDLPAGTKVELWRDGAAQILTADPTGWSAHGSAPRFPGAVPARMAAQLPDRRVYLLDLIARQSGAGALAPRWSVPVGEVMGGLTLAGRRALLVPTLGAGLVALDRGDGRRLWREPEGGTLFGAPAVGDERVYVGAGDGMVRALELAGGREVWRTNVRAPVYAGLAAIGEVVCVPAGKTVFGLDAQSGKTLWSVTGDGLFQSVPATDGTRFYVGGWDNTVRAIEARDGTLAWSVRCGRSKAGALSFYFAPAIGTPVVADGLLLITSNDGVLHAYDAARGSVRWESEPHALGYGGPRVAGGVVYAASLSDEGTVWAFDLKTGRVLWSTPTGGAAYDGTPAWGDRVLVAGRVDGTLTALATDRIGSFGPGSLLWQYRLDPGHLLSSPTVADGAVFASSLAGSVVALPLVPGYLLG